MPAVELPPRVQSAAAGARVRLGRRLHELGQQRHAQPRVAFDGEPLLGEALTDRTGRHTQRGAHRGQLGRDPRGHGHRQHGGSAPRPDGRMTRAAGSGGPGSGPASRSPAPSSSQTGRRHAAASSATSSSTPPPVAAHTAAVAVTSSATTWAGSRSSRVAVIAAARGSAARAR
ncbi:hypothetical protein BJF90_40795 [Pseudonocardia sp. CNS-004]|nr:hypothetical protein BJF90_40795 [Pseudonocardia sp. CNS-004]